VVYVYFLLLSVGSTVLIETREKQGESGVNLLAVEVGRLAFLFF
jgi:hypothetical protein